jgi:pyruvate kinase
MDSTWSDSSEKPLVKTKIIATVGPACGRPDQLERLAVAGVDVFRLNFAHLAHDWGVQVVAAIRAISEELARPLAILGDLGGPKIRLGTLPEEGILCQVGERFEFVRGASGGGGNPQQLVTTYDGLIDDLHVGDRVLLADGLVAMRVVEKPDGGQ